MKKYCKLLVIPALLWIVGMGLTLLAGGCDHTPTENGSGDTGTGNAVQGEQNDPENFDRLPVTGTPDASDAPTPTPVAVNTDTTTITYLVNREYPLPEGFVPEGLTTPDVLFPFSDTSIDKAKMTPYAIVMSPPPC